MDSVEERRRRQAELQAEAEAVIADLRLVDLLGKAGEPHRVGSSRLGLMVWRDIDVTVVCEQLDEATVIAIGADLAGHPDVREMVFRKDVGRWNVDPRYPDGLYLRLSYRRDGEQEWKLDVWFVDEPERQPDLGHVRSLPERLTPAARDAILEIKEAWAGRPEYGSAVTSFGIYTAVLDHGVDSVAAFEAWRAEQ
ncbi:hypothetical protein [Actinoplanes sp. NPDC051851]|uniref:hypothetical protein n=1 Tax=Actinoplanes sp. NPDC051851 TaxID=3154753 RepID=UPI00344306BF